MKEKFLNVLRTYLCDALKAGMNTSLNWSQPFYLQHTYGELKLLPRKSSLSHKKQLISTLRAMASRCTFQRAVCQQMCQKHSWVCKLVFLASFRCLASVNLSVQFTGSPVLISSWRTSLLRYIIVLHYLVTNSVHSSPLSIPSVPRRHFHTSSKSKEEEVLVPVLHMVAYHYPTFLG